MRIVRLANFVTPRSGGLRTALEELGAGYTAAGHDVVLVVPGDRPGHRETRAGLVVTVPGPVVPATGGYRVITARRPLVRLLDDLKPDRLEVSDRTTLRWTGGWARSRGVRSAMVSHESLDGLLRLFTPRLPGIGGAVRDPGGPPAPFIRTLTDRLNLATAGSFDVVICTTDWASAEFRRLGVPNLVRVPLGVDLTRFAPSRRDPALRRTLAGPSEHLLVHCSRLSPEKRPDQPILALRELRRRGVPAVLVVAGDGPRRRALEKLAGGLPVRFLGHVADRDEVARLLAGADVAIASGPVETFGLAALEALAAGTPVVVSAHSALPEVIGDAGIAVQGGPEAYADAIERLLARDEEDRRTAARRQATRFGWPSSAAGFLQAHELPVPPELPVFIGDRQ
ncbi:GDP-mannose-dependent alpha-(1-6)-phosphatidylinositol dimannoside mannosyltransferase [Acrocarpospora pleiomorpha]|uniref:GDP-mannose-dependent alpha-(1-6)-phosphatidylinositol dimannoside mannosyltransferase n=1 Tax=Acrocarpospora pleiomorpha TaxID=90975 RepID=A0A5M3XKE2_9ACTN|nr:glycosyltransferase [Acrocarpospora pleiomorpha]GES19603.1 GDP-mannose-dependent alpha-(1-6)-phosphatidylinositol dimannoside mannosyltransferase [Acrocarpospora pleiomorpha]